MKKRTFNAQRSTFNIEWIGVREEEPNYRATQSAADGAKKNKPKFDLEDRLLEFSARLIKLVDALPASRAGNHVAGQLLRCGTSPFANHGEVQAAKSLRDFIHKLGLIPTRRVRPLLIETEELIRIFSASIRTAEKNAR
jgi:hypothetical protein